MSINREDGRHYCDPASETPDKDGRWICPDDGIEWVRTPEGNWTQQAFIEAEAAWRAEHEEG